MAVERSASDGELVEAARLGDAAALGLLLERRRPRLLATALRLLGYRADAEDAVQETLLLAVTHLAGLREAGALDAWLLTVLRRVCGQHRRRRRREQVAEALPEMADGRASPEDRLERLELRDWVQGAMRELPDALRLAAMLRYFGSYDSYEELAAILGIPVGTVRSRLSEARRKLAGMLLETGQRAGGDAGEARAEERFWLEELQDVTRRGDAGRFVSHFAGDLVLAWSGGGIARGVRRLAAEIEDDLAAGVQLEPRRALSGTGVAVVEGRLVNPPEAPDHCPPGIALVLFGRPGPVSRVHLHLAPRPPRAGEE